MFYTATGGAGQNDAVIQSIFVDLSIHGVSDWVQSEKA
jgi:hypothetical protein